jgi:hypothetical protein
VSFGGKGAWDMADRDKDLAYLNKLAQGRKLVVIIFLVLVALMWIVVAVGSILDAVRPTTVETLGPHDGARRVVPLTFPITPFVIVVFSGLSLCPLWMAHNYFVISPLVREIQRLRAEIEALRVKEQGTESGGPGDGGRL